MAAAIAADTFSEPGCCFAETFSDWTIEVYNISLTCLHRKIGWNGKDENIGLKEAGGNSFGKMIFYGPVDFELTRFHCIFSVRYTLELVVFFSLNTLCVFIMIVFSARPRSWPYRPPSYRLYRGSGYDSGHGDVLHSCKHQNVSKQISFYIPRVPLRSWRGQKG